LKSFFNKTTKSITNTKDSLVDAVYTTKEGFVLLKDFMGDMDNKFQEDRWERYEGVYRSKLDVYSGQDLEKEVSNFTDEIFDKTKKDIEKEIKSSRTQGDDNIMIAMLDITPSPITSGIPIGKTEATIKITCGFIINFIANKQLNSGAIRQAIQKIQSNNKGLKLKKIKNIYDSVQHMKFEQLIEHELNKLPPHERINEN